MNNKLDDEAFVRELKMGFCHEASELINESEMLLMRMESEQKPDDVNSLKRNLHSLKGSSRATGLDCFSHVAHLLEARLPSSGAVDPRVVDRLLRACDAFRIYIDKVKEGRDAEAIRSLKESTQDLES